MPCFVSTANRVRCASVDTTTATSHSASEAKAKQRRLRAALRAKRHAGSRRAHELRSHGVTAFHPLWSSQGREVDRHSNENVFATRLTSESCAKSRSHAKTVKFRTAQKWNGQRDDVFGHDGSVSPEGTSCERAHLRTQPVHNRRRTAAVGQSVSK